MVVVGVLWGGIVAQADDGVPGQVVDLYGPVRQENIPVNKPSFSNQEDMTEQGVLATMSIGGLNIFDSTTAADVYEALGNSKSDIQNGLVRYGLIANGLYWDPDVDSYILTSYQKIYGNNSVSMQDAEMALTRPLNHYKEAGYYYAVLNGTKNKYKSLIRIDEVNGQGQLTSYTSKIGSASEAIGQYVLSPKYFSDNKSLIDTKTGQLIKVKTVPSEEESYYTFPINLAVDSSTLAIVPTSSVRQAKIRYQLPNGTTAAPSIKCNGYAGLTIPVVSPHVPGYTPDKAEIKLDFKSDQETYIVNYQKDRDSTTDDTSSSATEISNSSDSEAPNIGEKMGPVKIYTKKTLYTYKASTFRQHQRIKRYVKKARAYSPIFKVVGTARSVNGVLRYQLANGTYVTANANYVGKLYWQGTHYTKLFVTNPRGINAYDGKVFGQATKKAYYKQGTIVSIVRRVKNGQTSRYQLANGTYITGNKQWVTPNKPQKINKIRTKRNIKLYKDVDFTRKVKAIKAGKTLKVIGWDYSHGYDQTAYGTLRYRVNGGYVTANSKFIEVAKY